MVTDPIADLLTRIRNAGAAAHTSVSMPSSKKKLEIVRVLQEQGYINDYKVTEGGVQPTLTVALKFHRDKHVITGLRRESKPGQRRYVNSSELPEVLNGLGVAIVTTSQGVMSGKEAASRGIGGEYLCSVW